MHIKKGSGSTAPLFCEVLLHGGVDIVTYLLVDIRCHHFESGLVGVATVSFGITDVPWNCSISWKSTHLYP